MLLDNALFKNWELSFPVTPCSAAKDALSLLVEKKDGFDIVLTDFRMADMDGLQLLESIRSMEMTAHLPVVRKSTSSESSFKSMYELACHMVIIHN